MNLYLSHDAEGDVCKALVHDTLLFDLRSLIDVAPLVVRVFAPGTDEPYSEKPLWTPSSGVKTKRCSYKLRSVTLPTTMVHIGIFDGPVESGVTDYRVLLIFDTTAAEPTDAVKAAALARELERLVDFGVVTLDEKKIARIRTALAAQSGQYWTAEDTVLYFNLWFENGAVNGVKSTYTAKGCGTGVDYELPANSVTAIAERTPVMRSGVETVGMRAMVANSGIHFSFSREAENGMELLVADMSGRGISVVPVAKGASGAVLPFAGSNGVRIGSGCYVTALRRGGRTVRTCRVTVP